MLFIQLKKLQKLAEAAGSDTDLKTVRKFLGPLTDQAEDAADAIDVVREKLQSQVLKDFVQRDDVEMEPELESVIRQVEKAYKATNAAFEAVQELFMHMSNAVDPDLKQDEF